ncbi:MAG: nucleoside deaminase [Tenericutes bacterium]|nr:nucleoside deaminase [Mycoplasmatota bacterium]
MNEKYMNIALIEAKKAYKKNEVPIGCIIVKNNKIISKAYNKKEKTNVVTKHAEIIAIEKACKKLKTWHLNDCILYTTVEPCLMCTGAIIQSRMKKVVYATENEKYGSLNKIVKESKSKLEIEKNILAEKSIALLQNFFNKKRK